MQEDETGWRADGSADKLTVSILKNFGVMWKTSHAREFGRQLSRSETESKINMYTEINFKSKKALKEHVAKRIASDGKTGVVPRAVRVYNPIPFGDPPQNGKVTLEGPHYPEPHRWYAEAWLESGEVVKVK